MQGNCLARAPFRVTVRRRYAAARYARHATRALATLVIHCSLQVVPPGHVLADSVAPRIKTLAADWEVFEFALGATHIEYDGEYGSERVWIVAGRPTDEPNDGSPSFNVGPGDVVYFLSGFQCTWRVHDAPLVQRYGFFGFDGKESSGRLPLPLLCLA